MLSTLPLRAYSAGPLGPGHVLDKMKEVWSYLGPSVGGAETALAAITRTRTFAQYEGTVRALFSAGVWKPPAQRSSLARASAVSAALP
jgi:hypothetical protein